MLCVVALAYFPGIAGPYVFDDHSNLLANSYLRLEKLDATALWQAAWSLDSGALHRPVAVAGFALNYYLAGGFENSAAFKGVNIAIHVINGLLVFLLTHRVLHRLALHEGRVITGSPAGRSWISLGVAILWLVHPIQLTSVLYVVQRMAELSALFTLLALLCYLHGRERIVAGRRSGFALAITGFLGFGILGLLSKENALLLPLFVACLEFALFPGETPWKNWSRLLPTWRYGLLAAAFFASALLLFAALNYALPGYENRPFTLEQRVMTEARVLFFYIGLILIPRINEFGLHHQDIALSTSLFEPWTTLPSILGLTALAFLAWRWRRSHALASLGVLWFFTGHLLESTIFALEIAHEHRNYLASLGVLFVLAHALTLASRKTGSWRPWLVLPAAAAIFGAVTALRASHWSGYGSLFAHEVLHHPDSPVAQSEAATLLAFHGYYEAALEAIDRAAELQPNEASHLIWRQMIVTYRGEPPDPETQKQIVKLLATAKISATLTTTFGDVAKCLPTKCRALESDLEEWMATLLERERPPGDKSHYYYLLGLSQAAQGRIADAIGSFRESYRLDPRYQHPLFAAASLYLRLRLVEEAEAVLADLRKSNLVTRHPRTREINELAEEISRLKAKNAGSVLGPAS